MEGKLSFSEAIRDEEILTCNDVKIQEDPESSIKIIVRNFHIKFSRAFEEEVGPANCPDLGAGGILVPFNYKGESMLDMAKNWDTEVVIVSKKSC